MGNSDSRIIKESGVNHLRLVQYIIKASACLGSTRKVSFWYNKDMNNRILEQLEFDKVKQLFAGYLQTEQGQDELRKLEPMTEPDRISRSFDEMSDMEQIFIEHHSFGMGILRDISESMRRLELDADVNISEIIDIKKVLQVSAEVKHFYNDLENVELSALNTLLRRLNCCQVCKVAYKRLMTVVSLKILQVQNWTVFVAKSIMTKVEFVKFCRIF